MDLCFCSDDVSVVRDGRLICFCQVSNDAELRLEALRMISKSVSVPELRAQLLSIGAIAPLVQMLNVQDRSLVSHVF